MRLAIKINSQNFLFFEPYKRYNIDIKIAYNNAKEDINEANKD